MRNKTLKNYKNNEKLKYNFKKTNYNYNHNNSYNKYTNMFGGSKEIKLYNIKFISLLEEFAELMQKKGDSNDSRIRYSAYTKAANEFKKIPQEVKSKDELIKLKKSLELKNLGNKMILNFEQFINTDTFEELTKEKNVPIHKFTNIHNVGPSKALKIISKGITSIDELRKPENLEMLKKEKILNTKIIDGLKFYEDINQRIPRATIVLYENLFNTIFNSLDIVKSTKESDEFKFIITGSYRRGAENSGDIDLLISSKNNNIEVYNKFVEEVEKQKILVYKFTDGKTKKLTVCKIPEESIHRRVDFLYASPEEYPFTLLYFTGSKDFNTAMRYYANTLNLTLNEHAFHKLNPETKKKEDAITSPKFETEKDIFDYLNLVYKEPNERLNETSIVLKETKEEQSKEKEEEEQSKEKEEEEQSKEKEQEEPKHIKSSKNTTLKKNKQEENDIIIENIEKFKSNGEQQLYMLSEKELTSMLQHINSIYYNGEEEPLLEDEEYEVLREYVLKKYPNNKVAKDQHVDTVIPEKSKVKLPYTMMSMDKVKELKELEKFKSKYAGPYVISAKLDGVSGLYSTTQEQPHLYTRGNGFYGQNIDHLIPFLNLPSNKDIVVRGELIIKEELFKSKYFGKYRNSKNSRNFISGLVNRKKINKDEEEIIKDIDFVAYEVIVPENLKPSEQFEFLLNNNFIVVNNFIVNNEDFDNEFLSAKLLELRSNYAYNIDGLIFSDNNVYPRIDKNPEHAKAFKMIISEQVVEAQVINVHWDPSKDGYLKPRIELKPINLDGVTISSVTGHSGKFIVENKIGVGTIVKLNRAGGVIPNIIEVIKPSSKALLPAISDKLYKWNKTETDYVLLNPEEDETVILKNISGFFKALEIKQLGDKTIEKLIKNGANSIAKIINIDKEFITNIKGFGKLSAENITLSIKTKINDASIYEIAAATNIFGRGLGKKILESILTKEPNILTSTESNETKIEKIKALEGMGEVRAQQFVENIDKFKKFVEEAKLNKKLEQSLASKSVSESESSDYPDHELKNKVIVLTEFKSSKMTKKEFTDQLTKTGALVEDNVNKKTNILVNGDPSKESSKVKKANELNKKSTNKIIIMELEEFVGKYLI